MPIALQVEAKRLKEDSKIPHSDFTSLYILVSFILILILAGYSSNKQTKDMISNPEKDDVFCCRINETQFWFLKIIEVTNDSLYFKDSKYIYNYHSGNTMPSNDSLYNDDVISMTKLEYKEVEGNIVDSYRKIK